MNPTNTDRRRFLIATFLTLLALPALWWVSRTADTGAPNVASVDVGVAADDVTDRVASSTSTPTAPSADAAPAAAQPVGSAPATDEPPAPLFLDGPSVQAGATPQVAVPASPTVTAISTDATYRSSIYPTDTCLVAGVQTGRTITVVNLNNGRTVTCTATRTFSVIEDGLTMHTDLFAQIADLTDAPIPVEIRQ